MGFQANTEDIKTVVHKVNTGEYQLPKFQRNYVWTRENVVSLAATLIDGHPLGSIMAVDASPEMITSLMPHKFTGAPDPAHSARCLILDGQQRTTTIYHLLKGLPIPVTKGNSRGKANDTEDIHLFLDIAAVAQGTPTEDAIIVTDAARKHETSTGTVIDLSDEGEQRKHRLYPLFCAGNNHRWSAGLDDDNPELDVLDKLSCVLNGYKVPILTLSSDTSLADVHRVYVNLNREGKRLDRIDLLVGIHSEQAIAAGVKDVVNVKDEYHTVRENLLTYKAFKPNSKQRKMYLDSDAYLRAVTLAVTWRRHQTDPTQVIDQVPKFQLGVTYAEYVNVKDLIAEGYKWAGEEFLPRLGFVGQGNVPYAALPTVLAALYAALDGDVRNHDRNDRIARWLWNAVLTDLYSGGGTQNKVLKDFAVLPEWVETGAVNLTPPSFHEPLTDEALLGATSRRSALFKSVTALMRSLRPRDFVKATPYDAAADDRSSDDHHIFPKDYAKKAGLDTRMVLSVVNQTILNPTTNRGTVSNKAPSQYTSEIAAAHTEATLRQVYAEHLIDYDAMTRDDFTAFFKLRLAAIRDQMQKATGRIVQSRLEAELGI